MVVMYKYIQDYINYKDKINKKIFDGNKNFIKTYLQSLDRNSGALLNYKFPEYLRIYISNLINDIRLKLSI